MAKKMVEAGLRLFQGDAAPVTGVHDQKKSVVGGLTVDGFPGIKKTNHAKESCKLVSREFRHEDTVVDVQGVKIGGLHLGIMAGPCAVESQEQLLEAAIAVKRAGAQFLRGGAYKPRSSPYSFQGLEEKGLQMLAKAREQTGLKIVTEVMDAAAVGMVSQYADVLQIGTRNMQNSSLLRAVGKTDKPVLLKRGMAATISEWLDAAEYIMYEGNYNIILCERGIRTFETYTRNTLDLGAVVAVKRLSHLPVIVDPSHGTGRWKMVRPMACAAVAAGADGLIIEVHPNPDVALCDGKQSLTPANFSQLMAEVGAIAAISGKTILYREK